MVARGRAGGVLLVSAGNVFVGTRLVFGEALLRVGVGYPKGTEHRLLNGVNKRRQSE